jgi:lactoylglutathione lyase
MTTCCYARSDKYWVTDPQGVAWEQFHTLDSIPTFSQTQARAGGCCAGQSAADEKTPAKATACC